MNSVAETPKKKLPPMLQQYLDYKKEHPEHLFLIQVGDFYEAFFEDAVLISNTLNLTLTSRDKNSENPIPMAGVPIGAIEGYINRLVNENISVALVSQVSVPTGKGAVDRELDRIITPAIRLLGNSSSDSQGAVVASIYFSDISINDLSRASEISLAYCYPETGKIIVLEDLDRESLLLNLSQLMPAEVILPKEIGGKKIDKRFSLLREIEKVSRGVILRFRNDNSCIGQSKQRDFVEIKGYSALNNTTRSAGRLLVNYIDEVTVSSKISISSFSYRKDGNQMCIDASTRENLELVKNQRTGSVKGSLFSFLDRCILSGGKRLLKQWILQPSAELVEIEKRNSTVEDFLSNTVGKKQIQKSLSCISDLERIASRIELNVVGPKELGLVRDSLLNIKQLISFVKKCETGNSNYISNFCADIEYPSLLLELLVSSISDEPPALLKDGGIFAKGYNLEIDKYVEIRTDSSSMISQMEDQERKNTNINSLKIKSNNVHGYFIEVTKANIDKVPERYIKKQSTVNYERYYTPELKALEEDIRSAESKQLMLEKELYEELKNKIFPFTSSLRELYQEISKLDVLISFAEIAESNGFTKPIISEDCILEIEEGKHPIITELLKGDFVPNSISLNADDESCMILTGPNMGGKSTYLRQVGLISIIAQIGSYVPATLCNIGIVDKIFARIGASDDLHEGDSTFMVEMREASQIISSATHKSLILIDELGRGTATTDGMSLARSILEWIVTQTKSRTLFATHFHSLTSLDSIYPQVVNYSVGVVDIEGEVVFTHEICKGVAKNSYGIEVAKLAGLPNSILERATELVTTITKENLTGDVSQLSLFEKNKFEHTIKNETKKDNKKKFLLEIENSIKEININRITPIEALNELSLLQEQINKNKDE